MILANSVAILLLMRPRPVGGLVEGSIINLAALREPSYVLFGAGMLMAVMGMYFAYYYVRLATLVSLLLFFSVELINRFRAFLANQTVSSSHIDNGIR